MTTNSIRELFFVLILLLPVLYINVGEKQHWGDDFAQYIHQAKNIYEGKPFYETGFIYNPNNKLIPPSAPVGFSIMLVPLYAFFDNSMTAFTYFMALSFLIWALLCFYFLRSKFSFFISFILLFIGFYPNFMWWMKLLVTPDIPFCILLIILIRMLSSDDYKSRSGQVVTGILTGFLLTIKPVGIALPVAVTIPIIINLIKDHYTPFSYRLKQAIYKRGYYFLLSVIVYIFITKLLLPAPFTYIDFAQQSLSLSGITTLVKDNWINYMRELRGLFHFPYSNFVNWYAPIPYIIQWMMLAGFLWKFITKRELMEWFVLTSFIIILIWPHSADYRYMLPVHVFLLYYLAFIVNRIFTRQQVNYIFSGLGVVLLFIYVPHLNYLCSQRNDIIPGPYEFISIETFKAVSEIVPENEIIVFNKPRALALYTEKHTTIYSFHLLPEENYSSLRNLGASYFLYSWRLPHQVYVDMIEMKKENLELVYSNWAFQLYKVRIIQ